MIGFISLSVLMFVIVALVFWQVIKHDNTMRRYGVLAGVLLLAPATFGLTFLSVHLRPLIQSNRRALRGWQKELRLTISIIWSPA